ncbi:MAG: zinc ribbon domain-containing protein [Planctomycetota bacterium]|nr:zinc ribbon domain-containing protein [Planctomycetota bacterium]
MPTYVYRPKLAPGEERACDVCSGTFETSQHMTDEALTKCPKCGGAIERVLTPPAVTGTKRYKKHSAKDMERAGFLQYKKVGKGYYEKQFGTQGPRTLGSGG